MRLILIASLCISLSGCGVSAINPRSATSYRLLSQTEVQGLVNKSPVIELLTNNISPTQNNPLEIELHYKLFHLLNSPDTLKDWEKHYVIGKPSSPKWSYSKIANITVYQIQLDDMLALDVFRKKASELGGIAVIDIFRKPITNGYPTLTGTKIEGYEYFGDIVKRN